MSTALQPLPVGQHPAGLVQPGRTSHEAAQDSVGAQTCCPRCYVFLGRLGGTYCGACGWPAARRDR